MSREKNAVIESEKIMTAMLKAFVSDAFLCQSDTL